MLQTDLLKLIEEAHNPPSATKEQMRFGVLSHIRRP